MAQVDLIQTQLAEELHECTKLNGVIDVRVKGAIGVVQLDRVPDLAAMRKQFTLEGVWVRPFGDFVYLMPPLVIEPNDLNVLTRAVYKVISQWSNER